jgi:hypothetical protein
MVTNINKVLLGYQPSQFVRNHHRFRDHFFPHDRGNDVTVCPYCPTYIPPKRLCLILCASQWGATGWSQMLAYHSLASRLMYFCNWFIGAVAV